MLGRKGREEKELREWVKKIYTLGKYKWNFHVDKESKYYR